MILIIKEMNKILLPSPRTWVELLTTLSFGFSGRYNGTFIYGLLVIEMMVSTQRQPS